MEELQIIQTSDGRQFEPWVSANAMQTAITTAVSEENSVTALASEMVSAKATIADAIVSKGGTATSSDAFATLATEIEDIPNFNTNGYDYINEAVKPTNIGEVYNYKVYLKSISDNSIADIISNAFFGCTSLQSVAMPNLVTISGGYAFQNCTSLQSVAMPNLVTISGGYAFQNSGLTSVVMPNLITISGGYAFADCWALQSVNLPNLVTISGGYTFRGCSTLQSVVMPALTVIAAQTFRNDSALKNVEFGTLTTTADPFDTAKPNLRNITIGQDTNINLPFQQWTATNVISEGQSGIDELNANLQTNLIAKLYQGGNKVLRLGANLYDVTTQETRDAVTAKGWTLQRG